MTRVFYKEAVGAVLVFDVTRLSTFDSVKYWKKDLDEKVFTNTKKSIPTVLLANKIDLIDKDDKNWKNFREKMDEYCKEGGFIQWFETSAKDGINLSAAIRFLVQFILEHTIKPYNEKDDEEILKIKNENEESQRKKSNNETGCC
ncbi:ras-related protein rab-32 [Anaeramoeba flamelloides]|uniref:Ras-related protein rab-32 n=1 Tax=Anaeramoeba flamelloides TaxID=1746091 RepID=A0ABQ8XXI3_9EUKA|nr:ras-related protein rab-32 [Anaeramoeba flamelloides]